MRGNAESAGGVRVRTALLGLGAFALAGCSAIGGITGAVAGAASGSASGNPGVGIAVAIAVRGAIDASLQALDRRLHHDEQQSIATQIGATPVGAEGLWQVRHPFSYQDSQGRVRVLREFKTALADCREALFWLEDEEQHSGSNGSDPAAATATATVPKFLTIACHTGVEWQWALAEPATARWGALH